MISAVKNVGVMEANKREARSKEQQDFLVLWFSLLAAHGDHRWGPLRRKKPPTLRPHAQKSF